MTQFFKFLIKFLKLPSLKIILNINFLKVQSQLEENASFEDTSIQPDLSTTETPKIDENSSKSEGSSEDTENSEEIESNEVESAEDEVKYDIFKLNFD